MSIDCDNIIEYLRYKLKFKKNTDENIHNQTTINNHFIIQHYLEV